MATQALAPRGLGGAAGGEAAGVSRAAELSELCTVGADARGVAGGSATVDDAEGSGADVAACGADGLSGGLSRLATRVAGSPKVMCGCRFIAVSPT